MNLEEREALQDMIQKLMDTLNEHTKALSLVNDVLSQYEANFSNLNIRIEELKKRLDHLQRPKNKLIQLH